MSCRFERLQFLEYYQEKKSSSLNSARPRGGLRRRLLLEQPSHAVLRLPSLDCTFPTCSLATACAEALKISDGCFLMWLKKNSRFCEFFSFFLFFF